MPGGKRVSVCNDCGGYERCIECGKVWENLHYEKGERPCHACEVEAEVRALAAQRGISIAQAWKLCGGKPT